jgi:hypothetical protein
MLIIYLEEKRAAVATSANLQKDRESRRSMQLRPASFRQTGSRLLRMRCRSGVVHKYEMTTGDNK